MAVLERLHGMEQFNICCDLVYPLRLLNFSCGRRAPRNGYFDLSSRTRHRTLRIGLLTRIFLRARIVLTLLAVKRPSYDHNNQQH